MRPLLHFPNPLDCFYGGRSFGSRPGAEAERPEPPVRVAALLRIARVQMALDVDRARRTFQQALDEIRQRGFGRSLANG